MHTSSGTIQKPIEGQEEKQYGKLIYNGDDEPTAVETKKPDHETEIAIKNRGGALAFFKGG